MPGAILDELKSVITGDFLGSFQPAECFGLPGYLALKFGLIFLKDFDIAQGGDENERQFLKEKRESEPTTSDLPRLHPPPHPVRSKAQSFSQKTLKGASVYGVPFTFRLAADLALAAWKDTSPVMSSWQLYRTKTCFFPSSMISQSCKREHTRYLRIWGFLQATKELYFWGRGTLKKQSTPSDLIRSSMLTYRRSSQGLSF